MRESGEDQDSLRIAIAATVAHSFALVFGAFWFRTLSRWAASGAARSAKHLFALSLFSFPMTTTACTAGTWLGHSFRNSDIAVIFAVLPAFPALLMLLFRLAVA